MTDSTESGFRPWHLVPITWFAFLGAEFGSQAWLRWDWPKVIISVGFIVGSALGLGVSALLRPVLQAHQPSWTVSCILAFVGVPVILGVAELLRGDKSGGMGTIGWGVPIALVAGVVAGLLARRFLTQKHD